MDVREFLRSATPEERERVARIAGTSVAYLYQLAGRHKLPSISMCERLIAAEPRLTLAELHPDLAKMLRSMGATAEQQQAGGRGRRRQMG